MKYKYLNLKMQTGGHGTMFHLENPQALDETPSHDVVHAAAATSATTADSDRSTSTTSESPTHDVGAGVSRQRAAAAATDPDRSTPYTVSEADNEADQILSSHSYGCSSRTTGNTLRDNYNINSALELVSISTNDIDVYGTYEPTNDIEVYGTYEPNNDLKETLYKIVDVMDEDISGRVAEEKKIPQYELRYLNTELKYLNNEEPNTEGLKLLNKRITKLRGDIVQSWT